MSFESFRALKLSKSESFRALIFSHYSFSFRALKLSKHESCRALKLSLFESFRVINFRALKF